MVYSYLMHRMSLGSSKVVKAFMNSVLKRWDVRAASVVVSLPKQLNATQCRLCS